MILIKIANISISTDHMSERADDESREKLPTIPEYDRDLGVVDEISSGSTRVTDFLDKNSGISRIPNDIPGTVFPSEAPTAVETPRKGLSYQTDQISLETAIMRGDLNGILKMFADSNGSTIPLGDLPTSTSISIPPRDTLKMPPVFSIPPTTEFSGNTQPPLSPSVFPRAENKSGTIFISDFMKQFIEK